MMKNLRVFWFIQLCGALVLLLVSMITLLQSAQRNTDNITLLHQQVIKQLSNQFSGDDYKMLVQQIRNSLNPQQLQIKTADGKIVHEHNTATAVSSGAEQILRVFGFSRENNQLQSTDGQLTISFKANLDDVDAQFVTQFWLALLLPLLLVIVPLLIVPVRQQAQQKTLSRQIANALDQIVSSDNKLQPDIHLPDTFEQTRLTLLKVADFHHKRQADLLKSAQQMTEDAAKDTVTGLPNRNRFVQFYEETLRDTKHVDFGIFAITRCTELQNINQSRGYHEGDKYVIQVSELIQRAVAGYRDFKIFRLNSSDFGIILPRITAKEAENFGSQLQSRLSEYQKLAELDSVAYTGMVNYASGKVLGELLAIADTAISLAQTRQSNGWHLVKDDGSVDQTALGFGNQNWRHVIEDVLENNKIHLLVQLIQPASRSAKTYSEVLVRFYSEEDQLLPTASFLAMAEKLDKIIEVDRLIVETALSTIKNKNLQDQYFGLNLSSRCIHDDHFLIWLERRLLKDAAIASRLVFEVSEYGMQQNLKTSKRFIDMLHRNGARLTVEKFGTGMTSFKFFRDIKPDFIKMDGSYTRHIDDDKNNQYFIRLMVDLAHRIGVGVFAESVETQEEKQMLESLFIDGTQGYYIGKPQPI
jgi:EAL domain-containing protein (putative c-di-GMP-specific phosphodiesterase class I)/GGDEF domain-containing protein